MEIRLYFSRRETFCHQEGAVKWYLLILDTKYSTMAEWEPFYLMLNLNKTVKFLIICLILAVSVAYAASSSPVGYSGIGLEIIKDNDDVVIKTVLPLSPAQTAGLQAGDQLIQINGTPVSLMQIWEVAAKLRGVSGTQVTLDIKRLGDSGEYETLNISLNRALILHSDPQDTLVASTSTSGQNTVAEDSTKSLNGGLNKDTTKLASDSTQNLNDKNANNRPVEVVVKTKVVDATLYFVPLANRVLPETIFPLTLYMNNPRGVPCDELNLLIKYDPEAVRFVSGPADSHIQLDEKLLKGWEMVKDISNDSTGEFILKMRPRGNSCYLSGNLGIIYFKATGNVPFSKIWFEYPPRKGADGTSLSWKGKDILGLENDPTDGTIGASVRILRKASNYLYKPSN